MYGDLALRIAQDAKRIEKMDTLPPYSDLISSITREIRQLDATATVMLNEIENPQMIRDSNPSEACAILVHHLCMRRNKRCLMAYHRIRAENIERQAWEGMGSPTAWANHNPEEANYARNYGNLLSVVKGKWTDIDLTASLEPPQDLYIDVRVVKDAGEIQTEYGTISMTKNSTFYVRLQDVERLIQQGYLQRIG